MGKQANKISNPTGERLVHSQEKLREIPSTYISLVSADQAAEIEELDESIVRAPPGLGGVPLLLSELCSPTEKWMEPPSGLPAAASDAPPGLLLCASEKSGKPDTKRPGPPGLSDLLSDMNAGPEDSSSILIFSEKSQLKADSPMFVPKLSPTTAAMIMPEVAKQQTPLRTKLRAKASVYQPFTPGPRPFVPMASVTESCKKWGAHDSSHGVHAESYLDQPGISSCETSAEEYNAEHDYTSYQKKVYSEQEWPINYQ